MKRFLFAFALSLAVPLAGCLPGGGVQSASTIASKAEIGVNDLYVAASKAGERLIGIAWTKEQFKAADRKAYDLAVKVSLGQATIAQFNAAIAALTMGAVH
jgi:hypothetical protein